MDDVKTIDKIDQSLLMSYLAFCYSADGQNEGSKYNQTTNKSNLWAIAAFIGPVYLSFLSKSFNYFLFIYILLFLIYSILEFP